MIIERGIWPDTIKLAIRSPDSTEIIEDNKYIARKSINGKILKVVYTKRNNYYTILTTYYV
jgi:hypothetical protein